MEKTVWNVSTWIRLQFLNGRGIEAFVGDLDLLRGALDRHFEG